jgi:protein ImuA
MLLPSRPTSRLSPTDLALPAGISPGLARARAHEICGPSRVALALLLLSGCEGPVIWVAPSWLPERLHACGIADYLHPGRLVFAQARRHEDLQWSAEEALRSGAATVVVLEMPRPPGLTAVRRLHLAAQTGAEAAHHATLGPAPLALVLCAGDGGAQGVETRWHMRPVPATYTLTEDSGPAWLLERRRARTAPVAAWRLSRSASGRTTALPA